jgi:hypothetical protein
MRNESKFKKNIVVKEVMDFYEMYIENDGLKILSSSIEENNIVNTLDLSDHFITKGAGVDIAKLIIKCKSLKILDLSTNWLNNADISHITEAIKVNNSIEDIFIHDNDGITEVAINNLLECKSIKHIVAHTNMVDVRNINNPNNVELSLYDNINSQHYDKLHSDEINNNIKQYQAQIDKKQKGVVKNMLAVKLEEGEYVEWNFYNEEFNVNCTAEDLDLFNYNGIEF